MQAYDEERACARAEEAVVHTHEEAHEHDLEPEAFFGKFAFLHTAFAGEQGDEHTHRQKEDKDAPQQGTVEQEGEPGSGHAAEEGRGEAQRSDAQDDEVVAGESPERGERAQRGSEFARAEGHMRRQAAYQHGRRGDEASASGDGVHKACKEEENAQNQKYVQRDFHGMSCFFRRYDKAAPSF